MATPWYAGPIWQPFKWTPSDPLAHSGIDVGMPVGTPLSSLLPGTVISAGMEPWGGQVNIQCDYPTTGPIVLSYLHLSRIAGWVKPGAPVAAGAVFGWSGEPPSAKYGHGAHTHFEVSRGYQPPYMGHSGPSNPINGQFLLDAANGGGLGNVAPSGVGAAAGTAGVHVSELAAHPLGRGFAGVCQAIDNAQTMPDFHGSHPWDFPGILIDGTRPFIARGIPVAVGTLLLLFVFYNVVTRPALEMAEPVVAGAAQLGAFA